VLLGVFFSLRITRTEKHISQIKVPLELH